MGGTLAASNLAKNAFGWCTSNRIFLYFLLVLTVLLAGRHGTPIVCEFVKLIYADVATLDYPVFQGPFRMRWLSIAVVVVAVPAAVFVVRRITAENARYPINLATRLGGGFAYLAFAFGVSLLDDDTILAAIFCI